MLLADRDDVTLMVAGGVDELDERPPTQNAKAGEGAACVMLSAVPPRPSPQKRVRLLGWGIAGPDAIESAIAQAMRAASVKPGAAPTRFGSGVPAGCGPTFAAAAPKISGGGDAASSALHFVTATLCLRSGLVRTALVLAAEGRSASCAALLDTEDT
jgi:hypothetical protein